MPLLFELAMADYKKKRKTFQRLQPRARRNYAREKVGERELEEKEELDCDRVSTSHPPELGSSARVDITTENDARVAL